MWISGVKLGETYKKILITILIISLVIVSMGLSYVCVMSVGVYGITSVIALGVYG